MDLLEPPPPPPPEGRTVAHRVGLAARRVGVTAVGGVVTIVGLVLLFTPGPGLLVVAAGLAILATEYAWARHLLQRVRARSREALVRSQERRRVRHHPPQD